MPSKPFTDGQKSFYPDTSTISYTSPHNGFSHHAELRSIIEDFASRGNLVLSHIQVMEIAAATNDTFREDLATWLETIPIVWVKGTEILEKLEREMVIRRYLDPAYPKLDPFHTSFHESWEVSGAKLTPEANVTKCIRSLNSEEGMKLKKKTDDFAISWYLRTWKDQQNVLKNKVTKQVYFQVTSQKQVASLNGMLFERFIELYKERSLTYGSVFQRRLRPFLAEYFSDFDKVADVMPFNYMLITAPWQSRWRKSVKKNPTSPKNLRDATSEVFDWWHLAGAVYCDVFTCDQRTYNDTAAAIKRLGLPAPITSAGEPETFVDKIRKALEGP